MKRIHILGRKNHGKTTLLVEGDTTCQGTKIEVWRQAVGSEPMALSDPQIRAVITDEVIDVSVPCVPRNDIQAIAAAVLSLAGIEPHTPSG